VHRPSGLWIDALPLVDDAAVQPDDVVGVRLEDVEGEAAARREVLADAG